MTQRTRLRGPEIPVSGDGLSLMAGDSCARIASGRSQSYRSGWAEINQEALAFPTMPRIGSPGSGRLGDQTVQGIDQLGGVSKPLIPVPVEHFQDQCVQTAGDGRLDLHRRDEGGLAVGVFAHHLPRGLSREGNAAGDHAVERCSQAVEVAPNIRLDVPVDLLRADVRWGAHGLALLDRRELGVVGRPGEAEVDELDTPLSGQDDVRGLDVTVQQPMSVEVFQSFRHGQRDAQGHGFIEDWLPAQRGLNCHAFDVLHDEVRMTIDLAGVDGRDQVRVRELCCELGLAHEPHAELGAAGQVCVEDLHGDDPVEAFLPGTVHVAHRSFLDCRDDLVARNRRRTWHRPVARLDQLRLGEAIAPIPVHGSGGGG